MPVALGWATIDLDRAESGFADAFEGSFEASGDVADDMLLGARCRLVRTGDPVVPVVVLLEPFTEGRLAATLARHGEGPAAVWVRAEESRRSAQQGHRSVETPGPFGSEVLLAGGPPSGPYRLLLIAVPGTITP